VASLLVDGTPVPRKVSRLHLICDILHNSAASVPSAWKFRQEFQSRLGIVFDHLANIYHSFPGRITAETFKKQITSVVDIWEDWIVFPPDFTSELRMRLEGTTATAKGDKMVEDAGQVLEHAPKVTSRFKASSFQPAQVADVTLAMNSADAEPMDEDNEGLDGEPVDDLDGEPLDDLDGEPVDDMDGVPVEEEDDVDGVPIDGGLMEDDLDGEPMEMEDDIDGTPVNI
jgi:U2-associated protein SR140